MRFVGKPGQRAIMNTASWVNDEGWELPTRAGELAHRAKYPADWGRYDFAATRARGLRVLDCASGAGFGSWLIGAAGAAHVVGVDNNESAIAWSRQHFSTTNVEFFCGLASEFPSEHPFDLVVSFETIEHIPVAGVGEFVASLSAHLKPKGVLILSTPLNFGRERLRPLNRFHAREYNDVELEEALAPHFVIEERFGQHSTASNQLAALKRAPGFGELIRAGVHRVVPSALRARIRALLASRSSGPQTWISAEHWRDAPVQLVVARKQ